MTTQKCKAAAQQIIARLGATRRADTSLQLDHVRHSDGIHCQQCSHRQLGWGFPGVSSALGEARRTDLGSGRGLSGLYGNRCILRRLAPDKHCAGMR